MELKKYSISEASKIIGYKSHVLRYYESEFKIKVPRNKSNHRYYTIKEIETFQNIKSLQERGLTNNQIKQILNSQEIISEDIITEDETAITLSKNNSYYKDNQSLSLSIKDIKENIVDEISSLKDNFEQSQERVLKEISSLRRELVEKDQDIILCENAKLKMKVKQKSYEIAELKEQLNRERNRKKPFFKRIFN